MNIICSGSRYQVYDTEDIKTYSKLPVGTYEVCFNQNIGFYLTAHTTLEVKEEKIEEKNEEKQIVKQPVSVADDDETDF